MTTTGLAVTFFTAVLSPLLIAVITRPTMNSNVKILIAVIVTVVCIFLGQLFDTGFLAWPPSPQTWLLLLATFGAQQFSYAVTKDSIVKPVEAATTPKLV